MLDNRFANSKAFWARYEWRLQDDFSYPDLEDEPIRMKVTEEASLLVETGDDFSYISLLFEEKGQEELEIAWDDEGHFHPFVLRIEEWNALSKRIAANYGTEVWIPGLLLQRFVGFTSRSELEAIMEQGKALRKQSGLYTEAEIDNWPQHPVQTHEGFWESVDRKWRLQEPYGWVFEGEDAYSLRIADNPDFPYEVWNRMIAESLRL